jgi:hypothetical protein
MAAGVTKRLWEVSEVIDALEAWEARLMRWKLGKQAEHWLQAN